MKVRKIKNSLKYFTQEHKLWTLETKRNIVSTIWIFAYSYLCLISSIVCQLQMEFTKLTLEKAIIVFWLRILWRHDFGGIYVKMIQNQT